MLGKRRSRITYVNHFRITEVSSAVIQVSDTIRVDIENHAQLFGGYRGVPSFNVAEKAIPTQTRLHYANQENRDESDLNMLGDLL